MSDKSILAHISELVAEEQRLRTASEDDVTNSARLRHVAEELDQYWDLLRQRRAKREFGDDASTARLRDANVVGRYEN